MASTEAVHLEQKNLEEEMMMEHKSPAAAGQTTSGEELLDMPSDDDSISPNATLTKGQKGPPDYSPPATPIGRQVRDCTYTAICKFRISERVAPNLMGGELLKAGDCGSLYCDGDSRHVLCFTKFDFGVKQNIMFSFNPTSWECRCCPGKVLSKRGPGSRSEPITFVLSDQNFPACLPVQSDSSLQCLKIIRVEFGSLWELCNVFIELIKRDDLSVPTGTTILIGSASHLSNIGLSAYAEELAAVCRRLHAFLEGGIYCLPCPFILCAGTSDTELVRSTAELVSWLGQILGREVYYTPVAMELCARRILESSLPTAPASMRRLLLPVSLWSAQKKKWACGAAVLPIGAEPACEKVEKEIVVTLIGELNTRMALNLDHEVSFVRDPPIPKAKPDIYVVVGASHAARTAAALEAGGAEVVKLTQPGWRVTRPKAAEMAAKLREVLESVDPTCTVVFQIFDSNFYLARTEEGGLVPICKRINGAYHVDGDLAFAPKELQFTIFGDAKPLLEAANGRSVVLVSPIPRYLLKSCCLDSSHAGNIREADYRSGLESAVIESRKFLKDFCFRHGLRNVRVVGPWPALRALGDSLWLDPVHMKEQGYITVANMVREVALEMAAKPEPGGQAPMKRRRDEDHPPSGWDSRRPWPASSQSSFWQPRGRRRY